MKYTTIVMIVILILVIVSHKILTKEGFTTMTVKYWILYTLVIMSILFGKASKQLKMIIVMLCLLSPTLRTSIAITILIIFFIVFKNYQSYRLMAKIIFGKNIEISDKPTIYIANYPSDFIEYLLPGIFTENLSFIIFEGAAKILQPIFGTDKVISINLDNKDNFQKTKEIIRKRIDKKYSIFAYVEKTYYERDNIHTLSQFRSGMFRIASELNVSITPVVCEHLEYSYGLVRNEFPGVHILNSFYIDDIEVNIANCRQKMAKYLRLTRYKF